MAFQDYDFVKGFFGSKFVGFLNFKEFLTDPSFYSSLKNTLGINLLSIIFGFPLPIILAVCMNEMIFTKYAKTIQGIIILPNFMSWVVVAGLMYRVFDSQSGIINIIRDALQLEKLPFFGDPKYFWGLAVGIGIWKGAGWSSLLYYAAIGNVDPTLYEAAKIDGASRFRRIWNITLPLIMPTITVMAILTIGSIVQSGNFDQIWNLRNPMVAEASDTIDIFSYITGVQLGRYSYASAIGLTQSVISISLILISNAIFKKIRGEALF